MKSQVNLALTATVGILVVIGVSSLSLMSQSQTVIKNLNERNIVESVNQMEFIKMAIQQSAVDSTYQEAYTLSKYGDYLEPYYGTCNQEPVKDLPDDFPYWRIFDDACFEADKINVLFETKLKDTIFTAFSQYLDSIKSKYEKITIPAYIPYASVTIKDGETVFVQMPAEDKLQFMSEKLELSDNVDIIKNIKIALGRLINFGEEKFVEPATNPLTPLISESDTEMNAVDYNGVTKDCKQITLVDPSNYCGKAVDKTKAEILFLICPNALDKFEGKIINKITSLDLSPPPEIKASLTANKDSISSSVDSEAEETCQTNQFPNNESCPCIDWVCPLDTPVKVGDTQRSKELVVNHVAGTDKCSPCTEIQGVKMQTCIQYNFPVCPDGYNAKDLNNDNKITTNECVKVEQAQCPAGYCELAPGEDPCTGVLLKGECKLFPEVAAESRICVHGEKHGIECWVTEDTKQKICTGNTKSHASDTLITLPGLTPPEEYDYVCYGLVAEEVDFRLPTCQTRDTLHTKTCTYEYAAKANVLVNIQDNTGNEYPVYDEGKTDLRKLELDFYVLSGNQ